MENVKYIFLVYIKLSHYEALKIWLFCPWSYRYSSV